jgi:hypothetical protein
MLFRETVAVYCENHTKYTLLCGQNAEFWYIEAGSTYRSTGLQWVDLTPWIRVLEKLRVAQLNSKFSAIYGTRSVIAMFTRAGRRKQSWAG